MNIRIYRTFTWVSAVPDSEIRLGGRNPIKLKGHDELQIGVPIHGEGGLGGLRWVPVDIVEAEKPEDPHDAEDRERRERMTKEIMEAVLPVDRTQRTLTDGSPVPKDYSHTQDRGDGQQKGYIVLTAEERAKGFVRPVRGSYRHIGPPGNKFDLRELTKEERENYNNSTPMRKPYVKFEAYPEGYKGLATGRFWTQEQLDAIGKGCGTVTTMGLALAETYARDPKFYNGTFCCGCGKHFPLDQFVWDGTEEIVGS